MPACRATGRGRRHPRSGAARTRRRVVCTGEKRQTVLANASDGLYATVVVNGAESDPAPFKDRTLLRADPYAVLEGAVGRRDS